MNNVVGLEFLGVRGGAIVTTKSGNQYQTKTHSAEIVCGIGIANPKTIMRGGSKKKTQK